MFYGGFIVLDVLLEISTVLMEISTVLLEISTVFLEISDVLLNVNTVLLETVFDVDFAWLVVAGLRGGWEKGY